MGHIRCSICEKRINKSEFNANYTFKTHKWLCHYLFKTEEIRSRIESNEIKNTINLQNKIDTNKLKIELMELDICKIKVKIQDESKEELRIIEKDESRNL